VLVAPASTESVSELSPKYVLDKVSLSFSPSLLDSPLTPSSCVRSLSQCTSLSLSVCFCVLPQSWIVQCCVLKGVPHCLVSRRVCCTVVSLLSGPRVCRALVCGARVGFSLVHASLVLSRPRPSGLSVSVFVYFHFSLSLSRSVCADMIGRPTPTYRWGSHAEKSEKRILEELSLLETTFRRNKESIQKESIQKESIQKESIN